MVKDNFKDLPALSGPSQYQEYLRKRLETLSVRESYVLAAVLQRAPPRDAEEAADFALEYLRSCGMAEELIQSGVIDFDSYGANLLEASGYMLSSSETDYVTRNNRQFIYEYTTPKGTGMTMQ